MIAAAHSTHDTTAAVPAGTGLRSGSRSSSPYAEACTIHRPTSALKIAATAMIAGTPSSATCATDAPATPATTAATGAKGAPRRMTVRERTDGMSSATATAANVAHPPMDAVHRTAPLRPSTPASSAAPPTTATRIHEMRATQGSTRASIAVELATVESVASVSPSGTGCDEGPESGIPQFGDEGA